MELYGYDKQAQSPEDGPIALTEVSLVATPKELRLIAQFLSSAADRMDNMGDRYDHEHLADEVSGFKSSPDFILLRST